MRKLDLSGVVFGRLTAKSETGRNHHGQVLWTCVCECGETTVVPVENLRRGNTKSCGCLKASQAGGTRKADSLYKTWRAMMRRCYESTHHAYKNYGGRGVSVCSRWHDFLNFQADVGGKKPADGMTLDRINNDGDYEPSNCRWATKSEQALNRTNPWIRRREKSSEGTR